MHEWTAYVRAHLQVTGLRREREAEIVEDLARQLDDAYREALSAGDSEADARRRAERHITDWAALSRQLSASTRDREPVLGRWQNQAGERGLTTWIARLRQDVIYGLRMFARSPGVTAMAVASLALGIGANTALFSVMHALLFRPLPVPHPEQLVVISDPFSAGMMSGLENGERSIFSYHEFDGMRARNSVLDGLMAFSSEAHVVPVSIGGAAEAQASTVWMTSGDYFATLGVDAAIGRVYTRDVDSAPLAHPVAVVSHAFWRDRLDRDPAAMTRTVRIRQTIFNVIGVMPERFTGIIVGEAPDIWVPLTMEQAVLPGMNLLRHTPGIVRRSMFLHVVGRLKPSVTLSQADSGMNAAFKQTLEEEAQTIADASRRAELLDAHVVVKDARRGLSPLRGDYQSPLKALMALVGLLLLLACANVANLLLARTTGRQRELAVRVAMGAVRGRLIRQLLTESVMLASLGAVLGLGVAVLSIGALLRLVGADGGALPLDAGLDVTVLGFTAAIAVLTGILFGIAPAWRATRADVHAVFHGTSPNIAGAGPRRWPLGKLLAGVQVAISLVLLISAGLFTRTLHNLSNVPLGYDPRPLLIFGMSPGVNGYPPATIPPFFESLTGKIAALPGVDGVTLSDNGIFNDSETATDVSFDGYTPAPGQQMGVRLDRVAPRYFSTIGIPLRHGRDVTAGDAHGVQSCWLNETMSRYYFKDESPIGRRMTMHYSFGNSECEIRGVVADVRTRTLSAPMERRLFQPFYGFIRPITSAFFAVRFSGDPAVVATDIRRLIRETDPSLEPPDFRTVPQLIERRLVQRRMTAQLSTVFGGIALILASVGLYGVLSYAVTRRVTEIGVRMALGAARPQILGLIMKDAVMVTIAGAVAGLIAALAAARSIDAMLFGLSPRDPATVTIALVVLLGVALLASVLPAWRASRTDPLRALRDNA